jgi:hypothetical protein
MLQHIHKVQRGIEKGQNSILNPFEFFLDWIVRIIIQLFIPIPLAGEIIVQFKGIIIAMLLNFVLVGIVLFLAIVGAINNPSLTKQVLANTSIASSDCSKMSSTDIPQQNPLGGQGLSLVYITANFHDSAYFAEFNMQHEGMDFVPNEAYYKANQTYKTTGDVVACSTINGTVNYYVDSYGSHTVEVLNKDNSIKVIFMHLNKVFVTTGQAITAGTPVGTMGDTGFATGEHLHYQIDLNMNNVWTPVNPLSYIN